MGKIYWRHNVMGGGKTANLGHNFVLSAPYPMIRTNEFEGFVLGKLIGTFTSQEKAMDRCEEIALQLIIDLHKMFVKGSEEVKG